MDWSDTIQKWGTTIVDKWSSAEYVTPYEVQKLQLQALGDAGYYTEGQAGARTQPQGVSPTVLLLGLGVVALLILKD